MGAPRKEESRAVLLGQIPGAAEEQENVAVFRDPRPTHVRITSDCNQGFRGRIARVIKWDSRDPVVVLADGVRRIVYSDEWVAATDEERRAYTREADKTPKAKVTVPRIETRDVFTLAQDALATLIHPTEIHTRSAEDLSMSRWKLRLAISAFEFEVDRIDRQMEKRKAPPESADDADDAGADDVGDQESLRK